MKYQYKFLSVLLAAGLLTACGNDEPGNAQLPSGKYPLELSATIGAPQTRSAGKEVWTGDGSETFGVRIGENGTVAKYVITDAAGNADAAPGSGQLYWDDTSRATVTAWMPYDAQTGVKIFDQSAGFADFDYLAASAPGQSYLNPVALRFTHKMAKVHLVLKAGFGMTDADINAASVKVAGYTVANFSEGKLTGSEEGWITPAADHEALIVPQNMTGRKMIKVETAGITYIYTPDTEAAGNLQEGHQYTYTITVNLDGIEVASVTGAEWTDGGSEDVTGAEFATAYTASDLKIGDYVYSDGTFSDGGLRKLYTNETLYYADVAPDTDKQCVGIVFHIRNSSSPEDVCEYTEFNKVAPTGYIVSTDQNSSQWTDRNIDKDDQTPGDKINGYKYTKIYYDKYNGSFNLPALNWCINHTAIPTSDIMLYSSWYMPSLPEYSLMRGTNGEVLALLENNLKRVSETTFDNGFYATCGLMGYSGNFLYVYNPKTGSTDVGYMQNTITATYPYRAVCAFKTK